MKSCRLNMIGRFGNNMFQFAHAKAVAEKNGLELRMDPWIGEKIFTLDGYKPVRPNGTEDFTLNGYFQDQDAILYTRADCRRWFQFLPHVKDQLDRALLNYQEIPVAHLRRGDYAGYGYPLISKKAVEAALVEHGYDIHLLSIVTDAEPWTSAGFYGDTEFVPDFYRMVCARVLFRGNSSFSYWAAVLSKAEVYAPIIKGLVGGREHDSVPFVPGNWPALAELPGCTDLHLPE